MFKSGLTITEVKHKTKVIFMDKVVKVTKGGRNFKFRILVAVGDSAGKIGYASSKSVDMAKALISAERKALKNMIKINICGGTIPHEQRVKFNGSRLIMKPARDGTGLIAGGTIRSVLKLSGVKNIVSKLRGSSNPYSVVKVLFYGLSLLRSVEMVSRERRVNVRDLICDRDERLIGDFDGDRKDS